MAKITPAARRFNRGRDNHARRNCHVTTISEFVWNIHNAQDSWSNKADVKASILLALEGGALFAILAGHVGNGLLAHLTGIAKYFELVGAAVLVLALIPAGVSVFPRIGRDDVHRRESDNYLIFFGDLRNWTAGDLAKRLRRLTPDDEIDMLARQLVE